MNLCLYPMRCAQRMRVWPVLIAFALSFAMAGGAKGTFAIANREVSFEQKDNQISIEIGDLPVATYVYEHERIRRPFLAHVRALSGTQITRRFPPVPGKDSTDHATMHPGIWLGLGDLSGADFWRNQGVVEHVRFLQEPAGGSGQGSFTVLNRYVDNGTVIAEEAAQWSFIVREKGLLIIYKGEFKPAGDAFYFGDQEEMGLGVRMATPLEVNQGGWILDSQGRRNEEEVWGGTPDWVAYGGEKEGEHLGVVLMPSPSNFRPSWMHARNYGLILANPFGRKAFTDSSKPSRVLVENDSRLQLRYGILLFSTTESKPDFGAIYQDFLQLDRTELQR